MANKLVVAVVGYTGGVGTCLLKAMKKIDLKPYALVRTRRKHHGRLSAKISDPFLIISIELN